MGFSDVAKLYKNFRKRMIRCAQTDNCVDASGAAIPRHVALPSVFPRLKGNARCIRA